MIGDLLLIAFGAGVVPIGAGVLGGFVVHWSLELRDLRRSGS